MIRLLMSSPAQVTIVQMQDVLGLGSEARMNIPGRATGNWRWRLGPTQLTSADARRLRAATEEVGPAVLVSRCSRSASPAEIRCAQGHERRG